MGHPRPIRRFTLIILIFNTNMQREFLLPTFPICLNKFYQDKTKFWKEKQPTHCHVLSYHSSQSKNSFLMKRFPELQRKRHSISTKPMQKPKRFMDLTRERRHKLRSLSPLVPRKVFKYTNQTEARTPLIRKFSSHPEPVSKSSLSYHIC